MSDPGEGKLLVVSNRLPVVIGREDEEWKISPGTGGLVTALTPVMKSYHGTWVGWPGCDEDAPLNQLFNRFSREEGYQLVPVPLSDEEVELYYRGFSNETLWPLFHDLLGYCNFDLKTWKVYNQVNGRFAEVIAGESASNDILWVQDYQLILVGTYLRRLGLGQKVAFFLHIPFPSADLFRRLPWREELIRGLMDYDLVGFQTLRDRRNFVQCVTGMIPEVKVAGRKRHYTLLKYHERIIKAGNFPISIDFTDFDQAARRKEVSDAAWYLHENLEGRQLVLGLDRLDYTKGIPERFLAYERFLEKYPDVKKKISLLQVVVPSRTIVPDYQNLKELLDQLAGRINARFGEPGWVPIHYLFRTLDRTQLLAHYRTSEIAFITPLRDGMNLVAKEYCASSVDGNGVLILSEFAGAADQLGPWALLVNPFDLDSTADALYRAFNMSYEERRHRMNNLRNEVRRNDIHRWVKRFLAAIEEG